MTKPIDLSGEWRGHYIEEGAEHAISMTVEQTGTVLRGTMQDEDTVFLGGQRNSAYDMKELLENVLRALSDGEDTDFLRSLSDSAEGGREILRKILGDLSDREDLPQGMMTSVPSRSTIEGTIDGRVVSFAKRYEGAIDIDGWVGQHKIRINLPDCEVLYLATIDSDGRMVGEWSAKAPAIDDDDDMEGEEWKGETPEPLEIEADDNRGTFTMTRTP